MNTQTQYMYCTIHKVCLDTIEQANAHVDTTCEIILKDYVYHQKVKVRKLWVANYIVEREGMEIHTPPVPVKQPKQSTLGNALVIDVGLPFTRLGP